jgi:imidazolonepropionase-like amidohydrolase
MRIAVSICVLLVLSTLVQTSQSQQRTENKPLVLRGATVIDGSGNPAIPEAVIVIEKDRIKSVGPKSTNYPRDAEIVDLSGKFIIPGLVDSHVHYQPWLGEMFLNYGVTTIMWQGGDASPADRETSHRSNVRTPRIFATGGRPQLQPGMTREQVRTAVREWANTKKPDYANPVVYNEGDAQVLRWAAEDLHEAGLVWFGHTENAPESIKAGEDVVEHIWGFAEPLMTPAELEGFQKGQYLHWGLFLKDQHRIDQEIKDAVAKGTYLNPTLMYEMGSQSSLAPKFQKELRTVFQDESLQSYFPKNLSEGAIYKLQAARNFSRRYENLADFSVLTPADRKQFDEVYKLCGRFLKKWVAAGGKVIAGTDDPSSGIAGITLHMEMEMMVESGLTPMQALQAATGWGSTALLAHRKKTPSKPPVGILAEGAYADLVVLSANPLTNITNSRKIERVMKGGQFIKLGYTNNYGKPRNPVYIIPRTPEPEISAIIPSTIEGARGFEIVVHGVGFIGSSVVRVGDTPLPTTFVNIRTLRAKIPQTVRQNVKVTVFNKPPDGGVSNAVFLRYGFASSRESGGPQISAITPYRVVEGSPDFDVTVSGAGFTPNSVVRVGDTQVATTFLDAQSLRAKVPANIVARALPNRFNAPGPEQNNGVYGDRTVKLAVSNGRTDELSNSLSIRVVSKWLANETE